MQKTAHSIPVKISHGNHKGQFVTLGSVATKDTASSKKDHGKLPIHALNP